MSLCGKFGRSFSYELRLEVREPQKSVKLMLVEWFACFGFGKSFYSLFGSSFVISEVRLLQGTDGLTDWLEPLD